MPSFGSALPVYDFSKKLSKTELLRAVRFCIAAEYEAVQMYTQIADACSDKQIAEELNSVANDELVHVGEFIEMIKQISPEEEEFYKKGEKEVIKEAKKKDDKEDNEETDPELIRKSRLKEIFK